MAQNAILKSNNDIISHIDDIPESLVATKGWRGFSDPAIWSNNVKSPVPTVVVSTFNSAKTFNVRSIMLAHLQKLIDGNAGDVCIQVWRKGATMRKKPDVIFTAKFGSSNV